ncbi:MAG: hypothetical protein HC819_14845 [Cyclobacteriaceae bacterium]|nr:hypothetical protein [Cyclobacteriaceae bacterium]
MSEAIWGILGAGVSGFFAWLYSKLKTKRERKQSDLELINEAIQPLLNSIQKVTSSNDELMQRYISAQNEKIKLLDEKSDLLKDRGTLMDKVEGLEKEIVKLNAKINSLIKNVAKNNNTSTNTDSSGKL